MVDYKSKKYFLCIIVFLIMGVVLCTNTSAEDPYKIISEKNLFRPDRKEWRIEKKVKKTVKKTDPNKLELHGTIIVGDEKSALIYNKEAKVKGGRSRRAQQTKLYSLGDYLGEYIISAIYEGKVVLDYYGEKEILNLYKSKESSALDSLPSNVEKSPQEQSKQQKATPKEKASKTQEIRKSDSLQKALIKSSYVSPENMKKILEFNKEILEEMKESGGIINLEAIKERIDKFREQSLSRMEVMRE